MTEAIHGYGTLLKRGNGAATEVFTAIAEVLDIDGPDMSLDTADVTHQESGGWDEHVGLLLRGGEVTFDLNFLPGSASHNAVAGLLQDFKNRTLRNLQLVFPSTPAKTWKFSALVMKFKPSAPVNDRLMASVTLKISGVVTLA
jgi:hypothetical protein